MPVAQRRVLVTGASKGIGRAAAIRLARDGFQVIVHYHSHAGGAQETLAAIERAGGAGSILQFDVAAREACRTAIEADIAAAGPYYGVVSNAGIVRDNVFPAMSGQDWDDVLRTDLDSFFNVIQPCVMPMIRARQGGRIVTISSLSGLVGNRGQVNYSAAKAGIIGATKALALELASRGITVNCVAPGLIETDMVSKEMIEGSLNLIPMRRPGTADEVAGLVSYLMSDEAGYVTRQVVSINGGLG
jgi:3-oxoacyl-[acyl-carrier protein] reductase